MSAWRNEPGPLSFVLVTVMTFAWTDVTTVKTIPKQVKTHGLEKGD
jgi:hypothetical protein